MYNNYTYYRYLISIVCKQNMTCSFSFASAMLRDLLDDSHKFHVIDIVGISISVVYRALYFNQVAEV